MRCLDDILVPIICDDRQFFQLLPRQRSNPRRGCRENMIEQLAAHSALLHHLHPPPAQECGISLNFLQAALDVYPKKVAQ